MNSKYYYYYSDVTNMAHCRKVNETDAHIPIGVQQLSKRSVCNGNEAEEETVNVFLSHFASSGFLFFSVALEGGGGAG